jgi:hypothetical protein
MGSRQQTAESLLGSRSSSPITIPSHPDSIHTPTPDSRQDSRQHTDRGGQTSEGRRQSGDSSVLQPQGPNTTIPTTGRRMSGLTQEYIGSAPTDALSSPNALRGHNTWDVPLNFDLHPKMQSRPTTVHTQPIAVTTSSSPSPSPSSPSSSPPPSHKRVLAPLPSTAQPTGRGQHTHTHIHTYTHIHTLSLSHTHRQTQT